MSSRKMRGSAMTFLSGQKSLQWWHRFLGSAHRGTIGMLAGWNVGFVHRAIHGKVRFLGPIERVSYEKSLCGLILFGWPGHRTQDLLRGFL